MENDKVTFDDDFKEGFGFGAGFCAAASIYVFVWGLLIWVFATDYIKSSLP